MSETGVESDPTPLRCKSLILENRTYSRSDAIKPSMSPWRFRGSESNEKRERRNDRSALRDDHLEIFTRHHHGGVAGLVHAHDQRVQIVVQLLLLRRIECCERLERGAVEGLEHI